MPTPKLDPEWALMWQGITLMPKPVINDVFDLRRSANVAMAAAAAELQVPEEVEETKLTVTSLDGTDFFVHRFVPPVAAAAAAAPDAPPQRAIIYGFGGGMVAGGIAIARSNIKELAYRAGSQVFAVDYRLAPENPAPAAVEDFYSAAKWLQSHAAEYNVDPRRVVFYGTSAGGGIAAGAALMARDRGLPSPLAAMLLAYPMLDDRAALPADHPSHEYFIWTSHGNNLAWKALLGREREERTDDNVPVYASPARAKDLSGLPDTYIDVGSLDLFVDEDLEFAKQLTTAGVSVELHLFPGVPHGFDQVRQLRVAQVAISSQTKFLKRY
ncbi:Alpha/Beta hydrolase protein [Xylaria palmicola]|nr:Alpha/Beta hydrolase protein [Xylaria palmicola]